MKARMMGLLLAGTAGLALVGCGPAGGNRAGGDQNGGGPWETRLTSTPSTVRISVPPHTPARSPLGSAPASPAPGTATVPGRTVSARTVTLRVSGGFVGRDDELTVAPDGSWHYSNGRKGTTAQGRLNAAQRGRLLRLVGDPDLAAEARRPQPKLACADGVSYHLRAGGITITRQDCGTRRDTPTFNAVVTLLTDATPL